MILSCAGCGAQVLDTKAMTGPVAISCRCGAGAPICYDKTTGEIGSFPFSLSNLPESDKPHLEYYLGFSEHESIIKAICRVELQQTGLTSMADCEKESCRRHYEIQRNRLRERMRSV